MNCQEGLISQYQAALEMLKQTITKCPDSIWDSPNDKTKFWHIAYHTLFGEFFQPADLVFLASWTLNNTRLLLLSQIGEPYDKETLLEYTVFCQRQVTERVPQLNLETASGFDWLPFDKLELQIYTIRHIQQHTGELMERLGTRADVELDWIGMKHA